MKKLLATAVALGLAGLAGNAFAITDNEANASLPFGFANPGARSLGMGGAFIGLADDASAAYSNPAGLTQLVSPEIAAEFRSSNVNTRWTDGGIASYNPFDSSGLNYSSQNDRNSSLGSFSFVYPGERVVFAVYRNEVVNYNAAWESVGEAYFEPTTGISGNIFAYAISSSFSVEAFGAAMGVKATDRLSIGLGINYFVLDINTTTDRFTLFENPDFLPVIREANLDGKGGWGFTLGARYVFNDWLSGGLTYRQAPKLDYKAILSAPSFTTETRTVNTDLNVPDFLGMGLSIRPSDAWVINFDINRVFYSDVTDNITSVFDEDAAAELIPLKLKDGTEIHLGAEYTFATKYPFSLRAGIWHDPAHELRYRGDPPEFNVEEFNSLAVNAIGFSAGRGSQTHYAIGAGMVFNNFQIDVGADFSDSIDILSMSGVFRF
jgi:long-chain fatty acid transport protein